MGNILGGGNPAAAGEAGGAQAAPGAGSVMKYFVQMIVFQMAFRYFFGGGKKSPHTLGKTTFYHNAYSRGMLFDTYFHLATEKNTPISIESLANSEFPQLWQLNNVSYEYNFFSKSMKTEVPLHISDDVLRGGKELYVVSTVIPHMAYIQRRDNLQESVFAEDAENFVLQIFLPLFTFMKPFTKSELQSLVGPSTATLRSDLEPVETFQGIQQHIILKCDTGVIYDKTRHHEAQFNDPMLSYLEKVPEGNLYKPGLVSSDFWLVERNYLPTRDIKDNNVTLEINFDVFSTWYYGLLFKINEKFEQQKEMGFQTRRETYMMKRIILDTNPYMLVFSALFMGLHSVFSIFAFKNDMKFWIENKSMEGLSALSIIFSLFSEIIIGLYLYTSEETSWLLLFEIMMTIGLSFWKVTKAVKISVNSKFPYIHLDNANDYVESNTKEYDRTAIKWMSIALLPCTIGYAVYSLYYYKHKSWFSYVISVLAGVVYTFGFIMMTPQLYINYKLKSVDHLPWRALIYKSLNTFVDDVASFLIDMPMMHRLSCFRDDIIFLAYIYQRWIYKVDKARAPYGISEEAEETTAEDSTVELPAPEKAEAEVRELDDGNEQTEEDEQVGEEEKVEDEDEEQIEEEEEEEQDGTASGKRIARESAKEEASKESSVGSTAERLSVPTDAPELVVEDISSLAAATPSNGREGLRSRKSAGSQKP